MTTTTIIINNNNNKDTICKTEKAKLLFKYIRVKPERNIN